MFRLHNPVMRAFDISINQNSDGLPGISQLRNVVGASMTVGLVLAVHALIISAIVWAMGANSSNPHLAGRGKLGVLVAVGCDASVTLVNLLLGRQPVGRLSIVMCVRRAGDPPGLQRRR